MYRGRESNPYGRCGPQDFKSCVSTSSTTPAPPLVRVRKEKHRFRCFRAEDGVRTRDLDLGKVALYQLSYFCDMTKFLWKNIFVEYGCKCTRLDYSAQASATFFFVFFRLSTSFFFPGKPLHTWPARKMTCNRTYNLFITNPFKEIPEIPPSPQAEPAIIQVITYYLNLVIVSPALQRWIATDAQIVRDKVYIHLWPI